MPYDVRYNSVLCLLEIHGVVRDRQWHGLLPTLLNYVADLPCPFCTPPLWDLASVSGSPPTFLLSCTTKNSAHCCLTSVPSSGLPGYPCLQAATPATFWYKQ